MRKKIAESALKAIPEALKNFLKHSKDCFDENGQQLLENNTGSIAVLIKLFGSSLIDGYFNKLSKNKLDNLGFDTYLRAAYQQAQESLQEIIDVSLPIGQNLKFSVLLQNTLLEQKNLIDREQPVLVFSPKYHPAVVFVKNSYLILLRKLRVLDSTIESFQRHFNLHIHKIVEHEFGNDYDAHTSNIAEFQIAQNELDFLMGMVELGRIGFKDSEHLNYEETFAEWKKVTALWEKDQDNLPDKEVQEKEESLVPITKLIDEYFIEEPRKDPRKILFIVADFGKGKSVFLQHYASVLARDYLNKGEGGFPIYFNLRDFGQYSSDSSLGVIDAYLDDNYGIKIEKDSFQEKKFVFLIDSLDESGELSRTHIQHVMDSVEAIKKVPGPFSRSHRMIITSRPFDEGLPQLLKEHQPKIIKNEEGRDVEHFVSVYGFKKEQCNHWLSTALQEFHKENQRSPTGLVEKILKEKEQGKLYDIHGELLELGGLSHGELRRPIFAYMVYQLLANQVDFSSIGKVGIYLSFINLLTKEAKHIEDCSQKLDLNKEFSFRNLLHAIAALWMYKRQQGEQGTLKKADICRVLDVEKRDHETDEAILKRYKNEGVTDIQFLSHSYFGEKDNNLHFHHQSFAEILLAEYYLKVFIKFALDKQRNVEKARQHLILGEPTEQTIRFFEELLKLLQQSASKECTKEVLKARKQLFPLMASIATSKNNQFYSSRLDDRWFEDCNIEENQAKYPEESLENWCLGEKDIQKIIALAKSIMDSKTNYLLAKAKPKDALYDGEILAFQNSTLNSSPPDLDRWLALLVGNILQNDEPTRTFFNSGLENCQHLFNLIRNWNYYSGTPAPNWGCWLFQGIDMSNFKGEVTLQNVNLFKLDFSYGTLNNVFFSNSNVSNCRFNFVKFNQVVMNYCLVINTSFQQIDLKENGLDIAYAHFIVGISIPTQLANALSGNDVHAHAIGGYYCFYKRIHLAKNIELVWSQFMKPLLGLVSYGLKKSLFTTADVKSWYQFEEKDQEKKFHKEIESLQEQNNEPQ